jgi:hypothetical protein
MVVQFYLGVPAYRRINIMKLKSLITEENYNFTLSDVNRKIKQYDVGLAKPLGQYYYYWYPLVNGYYLDMYSTAEEGVYPLKAFSLEYWIDRAKEVSKNLKKLHK